MFALKIITVILIWLILREISRHKKHQAPWTSFDKGYCIVLLVLTILVGQVPLRHHYFEWFLTQTAIELSGVPHTDVHCNSLWDSFFDNEINVIGHATPSTGQIVFQLNWCDTLADYLDAPDLTNPDHITSVILFAHEVMHIRGELNEQKTECQAIQRAHTAAQMLGIDEYTALETALRYFYEIYPKHPYYSKDCGPGKALDENLPGAVWHLSTYLDKL